VRDNRKAQVLFPSLKQAHKNAKGKLRNMYRIGKSAKKGNLPNI